MWDRQQIEDLVQSITCKVLPKFPPQDIRPAYQQDDMAGKAIVNTEGSTNYLGFLPENNFIYIRVKLASDGTSTFIDNYGNVETINVITVTYTIYGNQSSNIALCLSALLKTQPVIEEFENFGFEFINVSDEILEMREIINEMWYERHDFDITLQQVTSITAPSFVKTGYVIAERNDVDVITHEEGESSNVAE